MITKENRDTINILIGNIFNYEARLSRWIKHDVPQNVNCTQWDKRYSQLHDSVESAIETLKLRLDSIWYSNLDRSVRTSVNYYRRKAGFKAWPIESYIK